MTACKSKTSGGRRSRLAAALVGTSVAFALLIAVPAAAAGCPSEQRMPHSTDPSLAAILSAQVGRPVGIAGAYREGRWAIYDVVADGEHGFVFFGGAPARSPKAYVWGGTAQPDEYADILGDVRRHVPGIPVGLARCFARRVTGKHP